MWFNIGLISLNPLLTSFSKFESGKKNRERCFPPYRHRKTKNKNPHLSLYLIISKNPYEENHFQPWLTKSPENIFKLWREWVIRLFCSLEVEHRRNLEVWGSFPRATKTFFPSTSIKLATGDKKVFQSHMQFTSTWREKERKCRIYQKSNILY